MTETPHERHVREQAHLAAHGRYPREHSGWWLVAVAIVLIVTLKVVLHVG